MRRAFPLLRPWLLLAAALALAVTVHAPSEPVHAQDTGAGSLDTTFGGDGKVTSGVSSAQSSINALAVLPNGKILAAGSSYKGTDLDFTLVRYNTDGSLDTSFGDGDGMATTDFGNEDTIQAVEVLSNGKILAAGYTGDVNNFDFALARFNADGSLDTTFGTDGKVKADMGTANEHDQIYAMEVLSDGKILVAGSSHDGTDRDFILARYTDAGVLDNTFGTTVMGQSTKTGYVLTDFATDDDTATSLALQSGGNIVLAGYTKASGNNNFDFAIARYTSAGVLDNTFDTDGKATKDFNSNDDRIQGVEVLSDGKVLVGGYSSHGNQRFTDFTVARFTAAGALDTSFDSDGYGVTTRTRTDTGQAMLLQSDGTVLIGGYVYTGTGDDYDFAVARFTAAGALDTTFGTSGVTTTAIGTDNDEATALAVQSDGKILLAGFRTEDSRKDMALVRYSAAGVLDSGFGSSGIVTTNAGSGVDYGYGIARQSDGKLVVVGDVFSGASGANTDFGLTRYNPDGTVDTSFGKHGKVTTDFQTGGMDYGEAVAVQSDGKIVAVGRSYKTGGARDFAMARYNPDGSLDTGFGTGGKVTTDFSSGEDRPYAIAIQPDDQKIVVVGYANTGSSNAFAIARYTTAGVLDTTFDTDGKVTTDFGTSNTNDRARAVTIQSDGKIVVGGGAEGDFTVARYTSAGALDTSFDTDGWVTTTMATNADDTALAVAVQSDGKIVAGGAAIVNNDYDFALARYSSTGALDTTFGSGTGTNRTGWVTTAMGGPRDIAYGLLLQDGGRIVLVGWAGPKESGADQNRNFALARYTEDGDLDTDFGTGGKVTTDFNSRDDRAYGAVLQPDGRIVAAGFANNGHAFEFALVRYHAPTAATVSLSVTPSNRVDEGLSVTVTVTLTSALAEQVTIPLTLTDVTSEPNDHGLLESLTIPAGDTSASGVVDTYHDFDTLDETFRLALGDPPSPLQKGSPESVLVTILDDDFPTAVTLTASTTRPSEGTTVTLTARLNKAAPTGGVTVRFQATGGTAGAGGDFTLEPASGNGAGTTAAITLAPGESVATGRVVVVKDDDDDEGDETIEMSVNALLVTRMTNLTGNLTLTISGRGTTPPTTTTTTDNGGNGGGGGGGGFAAVTVPEFTEGARTQRAVAENAGPGDPVGGPGHRYRRGRGGRHLRASANPDDSVFAVDADTGQLTVKEGVELAEGETYTVTPHRPLRQRRARLHRHRRHRRRAQAPRLRRERQRRHRAG